jgi:flagellar hook-basal body complex protein FliE
MEVSGLGALRQYQAAQKALAPEKGDGPSSKTSNLAKGMEEFADIFKTVETTMQDHVTGHTGAQSVVEAMASAEMAIETAVTIRNRVVEAYQELLRMPV